MMMPLSNDNECKLLYILLWIRNTFVTSLLFIEIGQLFRDSFALNNYHCNSEDVSKS